MLLGGGWQQPLGLLPVSRQCPGLSMCRDLGAPYLVPKVCVRAVTARHCKGSVRELWYFRVTVCSSSDPKQSELFHCSCPAKGTACCCLWSWPFTKGSWKHRPLKIDVKGLLWWQPEGAGSVCAPGLRSSGFPQSSCTGQRWSL